MRDQDVINQLKKSQPALPAGFEQRRDALLNRLIQEEETMTKRKLSLSLALALVLALALIGAAIAASLGVFGQFADSSIDKDKLDKLETISQSYGQSTTIPATKTHPESVFEVDQVFYDGDALYISYGMTGMTASGKLLGEKPGEEALKGYEDYGDLDSNADAIRQMLGEGFWQETEKKIKTDGFAHIEVYTRYKSDGAYLDEDTYINPSEGDFKVKEDGSQIGYTEYERPLPAAIQNKDSFDLYLKIYSGTTRFYLTGDKVMAHTERTEEKLPIKVMRSSEKTALLAGSGSFKEYSIQISAKMNPAEVKADIVLTPADPGFLAPWQIADMDKADEEHDFLRSYKLYAGDKAIRDIAYQSNIDQGTLVIQMGFQKPETAENLKMVPVYSQSGEHPEEAVTLK